MDDATIKTVSGARFPFSHPFAERWHIASFAIAVIAWVAYEYGTDVVRGLFDLFTLATYYNAISYGPAAALLLIMFLIDKAYLRQGIRFVGELSRPLVISCFSAVLVVYLSVYGLTWLMEIPREPYMQDLFKYQSTTFQVVVYVASLILFTTVVEEILFRHFVLSVIPFQRNFWLATLAVLGSAAVFTVLHLQYQYLTTYAELFAFAVVAGVARVMSRGLLLPVLLHAFAIALALILNEVAT